MSLCSFCLPHSWLKHTRTAFCIFLATFVMAAGLAALAQDAPQQAKPAAAPVAAMATPVTSLTLNDKATSYDAGPYIYMTRDATADLGTREIYLRHRNNLRGERQSTTAVNLSFDAVPHWLIFDIWNNSHRSDWVLDLGALADGRTGLAPRFFIQDGQRGTMLVNALPRGNGQPSQAGLVNRYLPLNLLPGQSMTLVMYFVPPDHAPFIIVPRIMNSASLLQGDATRTDARTRGIVMTMLAGGILFFLGGMFLRRGVGFFPHVLFLSLYAAWLWLSGDHIFAGVPGSAHLQGIVMSAGALFALATTQSIVITQEGEAGDSLLLYICSSAVLFASVMFVFLLPEGSSLRLPVIGVATAIGYTVAIIKALTVRPEQRWAGLGAALAWVAMASGQGMPYLQVFSDVAISPFFLQAPWTMMPLVCVLLMLSGVAYVRAANMSLVREVLRQAQRQQTMTKLKATKETADQARLLRVIEREREIMEDLRSRDAERTEEMRLAKITADEANRAKSAFLAVVSHEIRTPMTGIMGMVRLLLDTQMTREQRDYTQTIQDSGDAMLALLNDILDFSKIAGGGMELESIDFDLHRVLNSVAMLMNGHAAQRGIYLQTDIDIDSPRYLKGDPTRIRQVLLNLVGNAIKFTPRGGVTIRLRTGDASLATGDHEHHLPIVCMVEDTGIGISEEAQKNLFNPFSQADSSIARKFGGTGLGLAICKRLIEAMGGEITLTSVEGQGTTFHFTLLLPAGDQQAAADESRGAEAGSGSNIAMPMTLLVVDDNAINRKVMEGLLGRDGHRVTSVSGGEEAIRILHEKPFDVVFMDIEMPEMNGVEATTQIRASVNPRVANTPIIALTGNVGEEDRAKYLNAGMRETLGKPIDPELLRHMLLQFGKAKPAPTPEETMRQNLPPVTWELSDDELEEDSFSGSVEYVQTGSLTPEEAAEAVENPDISLDDMAVPPAPALHAPDAASPLLDPNIFGSLKSSLGEEQLNEMMAGVFAHNRSVLPTLQGAFNDGDTEILRGCAHELKGMNGNFGLKAISDIAAKIEKGCRSGDLSMDEMDELVFSDLPEAIAATEKLFLD